MKAHNGTVTVSRMVSSPVTVEAVVAIVKAIPGVAEVTANLVVVPQGHSDIEQPRRYAQEPADLS